MKRGDLLCILYITALFVPFLVSDDLYRFYLTFNSEHGFIAGFVKFSLLATFGEVVGLRIRTGSYDLKGFGLLPKALVWGFLGISIKAAFMIFQAGTVSVLEYAGINNATDLLAGQFSGGKIVAAFTVSLFLNLVFSPVLMTFHRLTDAQITEHCGSVFSLVKPFRFKEKLEKIDWGMHWGFVLKKTIPFFWIPAHTVTFILPSDFQVLFAACLGVALGVILAFAAGKRSRN
jgi:hypothetical protein